MLIKHAKHVLKDSGAAFIFGFPNKNSESIFIEKLGFRKIEMRKLNIPVNIFPSIFLKLFLSKKRGDFVLETNNCFIPAESEIFELKKNEQLDSVRFYGAYNNFIWGKIINRKFKHLKLSFFNIGGILVNKPHLLPIVFNDLVKNEKIDFIQLMGVKNNGLWQLFKYVNPADKDHCLKKK